MPKRKHTGSYVRRPRKKRSRIIKARSKARSTASGKVSKIRSRRGRKRKLRSYARSQLSRGLNPYFPPILKQTLVYKQTYTGKIYDVYEEGTVLDDFYVALNLIANVPHKEMFVRGPTAGVSSNEYPINATPQGTVSSTMALMYQQTSPTTGVQTVTMPKHFKSLMQYYNAGVCYAGTIYNTVRLRCDPSWEKFQTTVPLTEGYQMRLSPRIHVVYGMMDLGDWVAGNCLKPDLISGWPFMTMDKQARFCKNRGWKHKVVYPPLDGKIVTLKLKTPWSVKKQWGTHWLEDSLSQLRYPHSGGSSQLRYCGFNQISTDFEGLDPMNNQRAFNSISNLINPCIYFCYAWQDQVYTTNVVNSTEVFMDITSKEHYEFGWRKDKWDDKAADVYEINAE